MKVVYLILICYSCSVLSGPDDHSEMFCEASDEISRLAKNTLEVVNFTDGFELTPWGHKIHKSCLGAGSRDWFLENTKRAMEDGLTCLSKLAGKGGRGAAKNHASLTKLLKQNTVQIICHETSYDWSETVAHGTTRAKPESIVPHPGISVNPKFKKEFQRHGEKGRNEFRSTIFHEQLHNIGYEHGKGIEYPYTCEKCCFPSPDETGVLTETACSICSGNYDNDNQLAYVKDITYFGLETGSTKNSLEATVGYLKRQKGDIDGSIYLALNLSDPFNPIGGELATILRGRSVLNQEQLKRITRAEEYKEDKLSKSFKMSATVIADAYFAAYVSQDPGLAISILKKNSLSIKRELATSKNGPDSKYVIDSLNESMEKILDDVLAKNYYGSVKDKGVIERMINDAYSADKVLDVMMPGKKK